MMELSQLRAFVKLVETGSVSGAARALGLPKSTVSRTLARLEAALGAQLLRRTGGRLAPTETGAVFHDHALSILRGVDAAEAAVGQCRGEPRGVLRINAPFTVGQALLAPALPDFLARHPALRVAIDLVNRRIDPLAEDVDVVIRSGPLEDSALIARRLGVAEVVLYASPAYLAARGTPVAPADLVAHAAVEWRRSVAGQGWVLDGPEGRVTVPVEPRLAVNDPSTVRLAVLAGVGLAWLPVFLCAEDVAAGRLVRVLPDHRGAALPIHALFPGHRSLSPKVRVFIDFLAERFAGPGSPLRVTADGCSR